MVRGVPRFIFVLVLAEVTTGFVFNGSLDDFNNELFDTRRQGVEFKPKGKQSESTSSDGKRGRGSGGGGSGDDSAESLGQEFTGGTSTDTDEKKRVKTKDRTPKSTAERKGWRKWHRKCTACPEDMRLKWRDPNIKWICGAYQQARRSFKSLCMMHYRNCQDGTMFTKIADHRCANSSGIIRPHGEHFFYDYKVFISGDDSESGDVDPTTAEKSSSSSWSESRIRTIPPPPP